MSFSYSFVIGMDNPTYLKEPNDRIIMAFMFSGLVVGCSTILFGLGSMAFGVNKVK